MHRKLYNQPIVPADFVVPKIKETARMRLRPLTIDDAEKDFDAVISSEHRLKIVFDPGTDWQPT